MEAKKYTEAKVAAGREDKAELKVDSAYGFSISIAIGLLLFIAGLAVAVLMNSEDSWIGLVFGIPLLIAGLVIPVFMMRDIFTSNDIEAPCPNCGTTIKTADSTIKLECPKCEKVVDVRDGKLYPGA